MVKHAADELGNRLNYLSHRVGLRWSLILIPWRLAWRWLSLYLSFCLELCAVAGAAPSGYMTKSQAKQLHTVAEHLHKRIAAQDKMLQQLHDDVDQLTRDKKKALGKLNKAKRELEELQQQEPQAELPDFEPQAPAARRHNLHLAMHISVGLAGLCAWWYYLQDVPALERKLMSVLLSPVVYFYIQSMLTQWRAWSSIFMYCAAWFIIGFVQCRRLGQYSA